MKRLVLTIAAALVIVFAGVLPASAMTVKAIKATNPVAYDIKSLQTTRFIATVDTPGVWAVLKVKTSTGDVVVYKGAINTTEPVTLASWNGLNGGKRMASAVYDVSLTISKGTQTASASSKMSISRIYIVLSGRSGMLAPTYHKPYMLKGGANLYVRGTSTVKTDNLRIRITGPSDYECRPNELWVDKWHPLDKVVYLRSPNAPLATGIHQFEMTGASDVTYTVTVIQ